MKTIDKGLQELIVIDIGLQVLSKKIQLVLPKKQFMCPREDIRGKDWDIFEKN